MALMDTIHLDTWKVQPAQLTHCVKAADTASGHEYSVPILPRHSLHGKEQSVRSSQCRPDTEYQLSSKPPLQNGYEASYNEAPDSSSGTKY